MNNLLIMVWGIGVGVSLLIPLFRLKKEENVQIEYLITLSMAWPVFWLCRLTLWLMRESPKNIS